MSDSVYCRKFVQVCTDGALPTNYVPTLRIEITDLNGKMTVAGGIFKRKKFIHTVLNVTYLSASHSPRSPGAILKHNTALKRNVSQKPGEVPMCLSTALSADSAVSDKRRTT